MNPVRKRRLLLVVGALAGLSLAIGLLLYAISSNINLFYSPEQVVAGEAPIGKNIRVGGIVTEGSVRRNKESLDVMFDVTDGSGEFTIAYEGILPDLFREGQGIVANGMLVETDGDILFRAHEVLAKHDESYTPPEVQDALDKVERMKEMSDYMKDKK
ncbi:MAG TPA: cytochrome c maturation protein CcmE [Alcanivoracaceae bacterium]|nr:cytochrome c maturation protein CcmE [Alcanivoracaceae bacterium]